MHPHTNLIARPVFRTLGATALLGMFIFSLGCGPKYQLSPLMPPAPPVKADSGMVVAAHPLAAEAGVSVLRDGGNAVDAAIAALFVLNVVEPHASGLGGGGFALVRMAAGDELVVDYRDRACKDVDSAFYYNPADSLKHLHHGGASVCVPGAAAGWAELYDRWHTLPLERLTRDAIKYAEEGFPISAGFSRLVADNFQEISADSLMAKTFLKNGAPPVAGDTLRQPALASTFRDLTERGLRSFYRGPIAESVVAAVRADSGFMTLNDLEFYRAQTMPPVHGQYNGYDVLSVPPPSAGGATLIEILNLFKVTQATSVGIGKVQTIHLMSQCIQQAYADADALIGDPEFIHTDWQQMLSLDFAVKASAGIGPVAKPAPRKSIVPVVTNSGNTTHLVVVDSHGNAVSLTQSINYFFGAGVMAGSTGILLNNQSADFSAPPDTLNLIRSRHRPRSNMTPVIVAHDGKPCIIVGTPGGPRITSTVAEILADMIDGHQDISGAIDYPRFFPVGEHLVLENRFPLETVKGLKKLGYQIHLAGPYHYYFGGAHGISVAAESGHYMGSADKRRGGAAKGY